MNKLVVGSISSKSLNSLDISDLTGKQHKHILTDIRKQLDEQKIDRSVFRRTYTDGSNREQVCFELDYEQTMILVSGYSITLRAKIIKRWTELEEKNKPVLPQSFSEALQLAADQAKQLELQAPKVEFYDKVLESKSCFTTTQLASELNISAIKLNKILCLEKIQYKQSNQYMLYAKHKNKGLEETRTAPYTHKDGSIGTKHYLVWTEKGREFIHNIVKDLT